MDVKRSRIKDGVTEPSYLANEGEELIKKNLSPQKTQYIYIYERSFLFCLVFLTWVGNVRMCVNAILKYSVIFFFFFILLQPAFCF